MPNKDGTGPQGLGPMTGRGLGNCNGNFQGSRIRNRGRRCPARFAVGFSKDEEKKILEAELKSLEIEKQAVEDRIKAI